MDQKSKSFLVKLMTAVMLLCCMLGMWFSLLVSDKGNTVVKAATTTDVTETVTIKNSSYAENQSQFIIQLNPASALTSNAWWNINGSSLITANNGVDIMNYIYINGQNLRTLSDDNRTNNTYPVDTASGWLANSDQCRPAFVESVADGIYVTVLHAFSTTNYTITLKAGFSILNTSGTMSTVSEDVNFTYNAGTVSKEVKKTDVTETVTIKNSSYGENQSQFIIQLNPASALTSNAWWNIKGSTLITANNGVDIMNYIYINGKNLRTLSDDNRTNNTYPVDTASGWLTNSDQCRPAFVESVADGIYVTVLHAFSTTNYTITLKAGFDLVNADGGIYTISEDVNFTYNAGTVSKEVKKTDVTGTVSIVNSSYAENQSQFIIQLTPASALTSNAWWNINGSTLIAANNGVDIMNYIYINGQNLRTLSDNNRTNNTYPVDTATSWLANSDQCRPAFVESTGDGIYVTVLHAFSTTNYTITLKAGFDLVNVDGKVYTISEDVSFIYNAGTITKIQEYTLSFEGLDATVTVTGGEAIGELPAVPEKSGYTGVWQIDGVTVTADTVYSYGANKTATAVYTKNDEKIDVAETVKILNGSCTDVQSLIAIQLTAASTLTSNAWWNINGSTLTAANNGVDIMNYIYINGQNIRTLSDDNRTNNTYPVGSAPSNSWLANSDQCRPVFVQTTEDGIYLTVLHAFSTTNYTITIKEGFELLGEDGVIYTVSEDVSFIYNAGKFTKVADCTLSFEGLDETVTVTTGQPIGEIPAVPEKDGCAGVWTIDGVKITANTVYSYGEDKTAVAVYTKDVTETVKILNSSCTDVQSLIAIQLTAASTLTEDAWWNIKGSTLTAANNGVDIMNYIYINGQNIRTLSDDNRTNNTYPVGSATGWLTNSDQCRPVFVQTAEDGIYVTVLHAFSTTNYTITIKEGFELLGVDGVIYTVSEDVAFFYNAGKFTKVADYTLSFEGLDDTITVTTGQPIGQLPVLDERDGYNACWMVDGLEINSDTLCIFDDDKTAKAFYYKIVDINDTLKMEDWGAPESEGKDITLIYINNSGEDKLTANSNILADQYYWNDHLSNAQINMDCDVMEYIYINGVSTRELVNENKETNKYASAETFPFTWGGIYAPVTVETREDAMYIKILNSFVAQGEFTVTFKAGFMLVNADNNRLILTEDVTYYYNESGEFVKYVEYELAFEGSDKKITVVGGEKIGELPTVPETAGYTSVWQIDGVTITAETVYNFGKNATAVVKYFAIDYKITINRANGAVEEVFFNIENADENLSDITLTKDTLFYSYSWEEALPTELELRDYTFTEIATELPPSTRIFSQSLSVGESFTMNVYVEVIGDVMPTMEFTMGERTVTVEGVLVNEAANKYVYRFGEIAAHNLADKFTAILKNGETVIDSMEYSVEEYFIALSKTEINDELKTLIADIIVYAQVAESYVGRTETGIQTIEGLQPSEYVDLTGADYERTGSTDENVNIVSAYAEYSDGIRLAVRFKANSTEKLVVKVNGETVEYTLVEGSDNLYEAKSGLIHAMGNADKYQFAICVNGKTVQTVVYSVKTYVYQTQSSSDENAVAFAKALYNFGLSLNAYSKGE